MQAHYPHATYTQSKKNRDGAVKSSNPVLNAHGCALSFLLFSTLQKKFSHSC